MPASPAIQPPKNPENGGPPDASSEVAKEINWEDFRDHLSTADKQGHRRWVYPKKPVGRFYQYRTYVSWLLLAIMFIGPFVRINGNPLLMINIVQRRFSILGQIFWPQDTIIFAVAMLLFITSIIIFTTAFGRLWCGWTCPQTLLMEMVFRKIEYAIEGDAGAQRQLAAAPWSATKAGKKLLKHGIFFGLSFVIGNTLLSYIIGSDELLKIISEPPGQHLQGLTFMVLFTLLFYAIFARFREQACTFICPYGRFQSAMLDENTLVVAYDHKRGERRGSCSGSKDVAVRKAGGYGDCVDCRLCVAVCPTGIDIRNGTQMECVNCTACIDACDGVMDKVGRPRGLIKYGSLNTIDKGEKFRFTPRMGIYAVVLTALTALLIYLVFTRTDVETTFLRAPGSLFQVAQDGRIENLYLVKVVNKTTRGIPLQFKIENRPGKLQVMGGKFEVPDAGMAQTSVLIEMEPGMLESNNTRLKIGVYSGDRLLEYVNTVFVSPRDKVPAATSTPATKTATP